MKLPIGEIRISRALAERAAKSGLWTLILAVTFWSFNHDGWISEALANYTMLSATSTTTRTTTAANGSIITQTVIGYATITQTGAYSGPHTSTDTSSSTDTSCHTGGSQYGGGQWNYCNRTDQSHQKNSESDTKDLNDNGSNQSTALGMAAIAAGMAMVAAGVALMANPPTVPAGVALVAAGMALIAAGMAALAAAKKMNNNANKANGYANNLDAMPYQSTISPTSDSGSGDFGNANLGKADAGAGIKIDPALTRTGKMDGIYTDMENKTGLNRDDLTKALADGADPLALLANSPALANKPNASEASLRKMMDDTLAKGDLPGAQEVMDKLGLTAEDVGAGKVGTDPNRGLASANPNIDALFPNSAGDKVQPGNAGSAGNLKVSSEIQAALDKNGITARNLFEMVHSQYMKKTPLMFGVQQKRDGTAANPYANLVNEKMEL